MRHRHRGHGHGEGPWCPPWKESHHYRGRRMGKPLRWRIFVWFGISILLTGLITFWTMGVLWHAGWHATPWKPVVLLFVSSATLWALSGFIARRLARPLAHVADVARDIGEGKLSSRVRLRRTRIGEAAVLAEAINDMAGRIEKQIADQRELLATVSHEIRTPLGHMRILLEMARDKGAGEEVLTEMEKELDEVDSLVGELLASSRLEFDAVERRTVDAAEAARRALSRAGLPESLLEAPAGKLELDADPTLLARALANLLDNAKKHAGGATALRVSNGDSRVSFTVEDAGPGFDDETRVRAFEPFFRSERSAGAGHPSLGLGLALVQRIARAHGGSVRAENREPEGARVTLELAQTAHSS